LNQGRTWGDNWAIAPRNFQKHENMFRCQVQQQVNNMLSPKISAGYGSELNQQLIALQVEHFSNTIHGMSSVI